MELEEILKNIFSLDALIQCKILNYIPEIRTILILELKNNNKRCIYQLEKEIKKKRKYNDRYKNILYISCPHISYTTERWNDYHHNYTTKRCDLCKLELRYNDGLVESKYIYLY